MVEFPSWGTYLKAFPQLLASCGLSVLLGFNDRDFLFLQGNLVAVGTHKGFVQIWDAAAGKKLSMLEGHTARVGKEVGGRSFICCISSWLNFSHVSKGSAETAEIRRH